MNVPVKATTVAAPAFALRVTDDTMAPRYKRGEYMLVEPDTPAAVGDDVLVLLVTGETLFRCLLSRTDGVRLGSYGGAMVLTLEPHQISCIQYVAHPLPARGIHRRADVQLAGVGAGAGLLAWPPRAALGLPLPHATEASSCPSKL